VVVVLDLDLDLDLVSVDQVQVEVQVQVHVQVFKSDEVLTLFIPANGSSQAIGSDGHLTHNRRTKT